MHRIAGNAPCLDLMNMDEYVALSESPVAKLRYFLLFFCYTVMWHASFCSDEGNLDEIDPGHMVW